MDRRNFLRTIVGGVAVGAAVRQWPFRVFSFSKDIVSSRQDLGCSVLDYSGIPIVEDPAVPVGKIYLVRLKPVFDTGYRSEMRVGAGVLVNVREHSRTIGAPSSIRESIASLHEREHLSVVEGKPSLGSFIEKSNGYPCEAT